MRHRSTAEAVNELADRYVAVWNEPDAEARRSVIRKLWTEGGAQILQPPQEVHETATTLGMDATLEARGHEALETRVTRVTRAYEEFVAPGEYRFRRRPNAARLDGIVKFNWELVRTSDGTVAGVGLELLVHGDDSRIVTDYQFIEGRGRRAASPPGLVLGTKRIQPGWPAHLEACSRGGSNALMYTSKCYELVRSQRRPTIRRSAHLSLLVL